jgi:hypothetical protein
MAFERRLLSSPRVPVAKTLQQGGFRKIFGVCERCLSCQVKIDPATLQVAES